MMKKLLLLSLIITMVLILFSACANNKPKTLEEWQGTTYMIANENHKTTYNKEYHIQYFHATGNAFGYCFNDILNYEDYDKLCSNLKINKKYNDENKKYAIVSYANVFAENIDAKLIDAEYKENTITMYIREDMTIKYNPDGFYGYVVIIPLEKDVESVKVVPVITKQEFEEIQKDQLVVDKPVIYLYPEKEMEVSIKLVHKDNITCSYPKYNSGWNVIANPNGTLKDIQTGRELYSLYYEAIPTIKPQMTNEGFVVKGEDTIAFLEDKLAILGLNEREAEEFIIYWLPILESNKYNYIRFATTKEIDEMIPIEINPAPQTTIRVMMFFKGLENPIEIKEQTIAQQNRNGFTVIEWGGCELQ